MKVAVSIPEGVFHKAERVAQRLRLSRSRLYARAIEEYVEKHAHPDVTAALNAVYDKEPPPRDPAFERLSTELLRRVEW
jgi:metal-responsive CopG/Arc/MetJ family transcriptional regulator